MAALGGTNEFETDTVEIIDLQSINSTCTLISKFPNSTYSAVGGLGPNERPIICDGQFSNECYSYINKTWSAFPSMSIRRYFSAVSKSPYPDKSHFFLVTGGYSGDDYFNTSEVLTPKGWQNLSTNLPTGMLQHCAVLINATTVMLIGGSTSHDSDASDYRYSKKTYLFNSENESWSEGPTLISGRNSHTCAKIKKSSQSSQYSIIVVGGYNGWSMSSVEILEEGASEWVAGPEFPFPILDSSMIEYSDGSVFLIGGRKVGSSRVALDTIFQLQHGQADWIEKPQKLKEARYWATAFLVPDEIADCS